MPPQSSSKNYQTIKAHSSADFDHEQGHRRVPCLRNILSYHQNGLKTYSHIQMVATSQFSGCLASSLWPMFRVKWVASLLLISICAPRFLHEFFNFLSSTKTNSCMCTHKHHNDHTTSFLELFCFSWEVTFPCSGPACNSGYKFPS